MSQVFGQNNRRIARGFWATVLLIMLGLFIVWFTDRLNHYLSNPVKVSMKIKRAAEMVFPTITICYKQFYNPVRARPYEMKTANEFDLKKSQVTLGHMMAVFNDTELWRNIGFQVDDLFQECFFGRNLTCQSQGRFIPVLTTMGLCHKYVHEVKIKNSGPFNNFYAKLKDPPPPIGEDEGWKLLLGGNKGTPALRMTTSSMTIYPNWEPDIQVSVKEFKTLSTTSDPCIDDRNYSELDCELECFQNTFKVFGGCWLPFMTPDSQGSIPRCNTPEDFNGSMDLAHSLLFGGNWTRDGCRCLSGCEDFVYEAFSDSREQRRNTTRIRIYYHDLTYQTVNEDWAYNIISFMCDVGGALGLLLGASVLTFIEILECAFACCSRSNSRNKNEISSIIPP